jgi:hypothetical protein
MSRWPALLIAAALAGAAPVSAAPIILVCKGDAFPSSDARRLLIDPDRHSFDGLAEGLTQAPADDGVSMKTCRASFVATKATWGMISRCEGLAKVDGNWTNALSTERWSLDRATGRLTYGWRDASTAVDKMAMCAPGGP